MKENSKLLGAFVAATLASTTFALSAEPIGDHPRKWSQPSYDEAPDSSLSSAPKLEDFIAIPEDDDAALLDGDGRPLVQDKSPAPRR